MKNYNNKKALILAAASLALAAPMAMAQVAAGPVKANVGAGVDANAATQVNAVHDQAAAQMGARADVKTQAQMQATPPATPATPAVPPTADATKATPAVPATPAAPVAKANGEKKWSDLDGDGNGTLSAAEAQGMPSLSKIFVEADVNADGELSQDEYKAWVASNNAARAKAKSDS